MRIENILNYAEPNYAGIFKVRLERINNIRSNPDILPHLKTYYRHNPAQFIIDYGCTYDPRNVERGLPANIPFILFPKQIEWINWVIAHWKAQKPGITEKTRDMGMSWLSVALACTLCLFNDGISIGFGSRKEEYVDKLGLPKSLLEKARLFMSMLPVEFRGGWERDKHAPHMRIIFPESGSLISGESGDGIGRGDRQSIYFIDEAAFLERPALIESSLSQTTNCRIDISTPNGLANPFAEKRHSGKIDVFTFHWRDDPRKNDEWYQKQLTELDPVTIAQEINIDYSASVENVLIPGSWVQSAINSHIGLGIKPSGVRMGAIDVADEGKDLNAFCGRYGVLVEYMEAWSGKGGDIYDTVQRCFKICDMHGYKRLVYDADGLGAGVRGDAKELNRKRTSYIAIEQFRGSGAVHKPEKEMVTGRTNQDYFVNAKAQAWWHLRTLFQNTHRAIVDGLTVKPDEIISISSEIPNYMRLVTELSQPTFTINTSGKIIVDKSPDGTKSPNLADAVMMCFAPGVERARGLRMNPYAVPGTPQYNKIWGS